MPKTIWSDVVVARNEAAQAANSPAMLDWNEVDEKVLVDDLAVEISGAPFPSTRSRNKARGVLALLRERGILATDRAFE